jgi:predicted DNA-binding transcriptional regulator YafY
VNRTERLHAVVAELRARSPLTARALAERFGVGERVVERDVAALQRAGVPVRAEAGGYALDAAPELPPMALTAAEAVAAGVGLARTTEAPFAGSARTGLRKVVAALSAADDAEVREMAERIRFLVSDSAEDRASVPAVIEEAVALRQVVRIAYVDRDGRETERDVEPVAFVAGARDWYLIGWCRLREGPRPFRVGRIRRADLRDETAPVRDLGDMTPSVSDLVAHALKPD